MKFFHLGDLHFGKELHENSLLEDQRAWVEEFIKQVDSCGVDAVVIAGDVYDKKIPSPEAMQLFDDLLKELVERDKYVYIIPGNHDHEVRLAQYSAMLEKRQVYVAGKIQKEMKHFTLALPGDVPVTFWLMPFAYPTVINDVLERKDLNTYDQAVREYLGIQDIDKSACNILIAHQNVVNGELKPEHSASESIVGFLGEIDYTAFDDFDYVALGHIHNAQYVGRENIRYAGCPLYYDFSEEKRDKRLTLVTVNSKDDIRTDRIEIPFLHTLCVKTGTVEELIEIGKAMHDKEKYYIQCITTDRHLPAGTNEKLRNAFGNTMISKKRKRDLGPDGQNPGEVSGESGKGRLGLDIEEQFRMFYEGSGDLLETAQEKLIKKMIEQQTAKGLIFAEGEGKANSSGEKKLTPDQSTAIKELLEVVYGMIDEKDTEVTE